MERTKKCKNEHQKKYYIFYYLTADCANFHGLFVKLKIKNKI